MRTVVSLRTPGAVLAAVSMLIVVPRAAPSSNAVSLAVEGRSNTTPSVASDGSFVAVAWGATSAGKTDVFVAVSRDGGQTFGPPVQANVVAGEARLGGEFPPRVSLASTRGSADPEIAVVWTARGDTTQIKTTRSRDGGKTFESPVTLQASGAPGGRGWPALALDKHGTAHAIWLDHRGLAAGHVGGGSHAGHQSGGESDGAARAQKSGLYYTATKGSPSSERELAKGVCYCCKTALAVGSDGSVYAAWRHVYPGNLRDMAFTVSRDAGRSFSEPVRVSEDGWVISGCPDDGPAMAVDTHGTVHLVWPTVVGGSNPEGALFYASTKDGRTFTKRTRIPTLGSLKPSHPQIVVDGSGRIAVAWDELIDGQRVAAVRALSVNADRTIGFGSIVPVSPDGPAMYPVLAASGTDIVAVWTTGGEPSVVQARRIRLP